MVRLVIRHSTLLDRVAGVACVLLGDGDAILVVDQIL